MRRVSVLLAGMLTACAGGGGSSDQAAQAPTPTTAAAIGACGLKPISIATTPATEDLYAATSARVAGAECPVAVERISTGAVPGHVLALPSCEPLPALAPC